MAGHRVSQQRGELGQVCVQGLPSPANLWNQGFAEGKYILDTLGSVAGQFPVMGDLSSIWRFMRAVVRHWGSLVTSGFIIGAVGLWAAAGHHVPAGVYWAIAVAGLFIAFYRVWNDAEKARAKLEKQLRTTSSEWKELENNFSQLTQSHAFVLHVHHCSNKAHDYWQFQGAGPIYIDQIRSLCEKAGKLLIRSAHIELSDEIKEVNSNEWKWLYFVKTVYWHLGKSEEGRDGEDHVTIEWLASNIAQLSAQACLKCAALEF